MLTMRCENKQFCILFQCYISENVLYKLHHEILESRRKYFERDIFHEKS